ncbi:MAG: hypothetical protein M3Y08_13670 [Fibrobacterota bacterium]|nr:hypothetical protein [Fibrobacterota bacterium]
MKGVSLPDGWLEFKGRDVANMRPGTHAKHFLLNWGKDLGWARYDAESLELQVESVRFGYEDGSWDDFSTLTWHVATPDYKSFLIYQGRGISLFRKPNSNKADMQVLDLEYNGGANWMAVDPGFQKAMVPLQRKINMFKDADLGGTPLVPFKVDLVKGAFTPYPMDHYADSYLGPDFILWRHYAPGKSEGESAVTTHFSATDFDLKDRENPLVTLLNRRKDSLPDFMERFAISPQGWALMGVHSLTLQPAIYLLSPQGDGSIQRLFEGGTIPIPDESLRRCAVSGDGQYFATITSHDREYFPSAKGHVIHLGRVEKLNGGFAARITRIGDFPDLWIGPPVWIPGTHALVVNTNPIDKPSLLRIYDLDKHPIDWSKVPFATPVEAVGP